MTPGAALRGARRLRRARPGIRYAIACVLTVVAVAATFGLGSMIGRVPTVPLFATVLVVAWLVGLGPAMVAAAISVLALDRIDTHLIDIAPSGIRDAAWVALFFVTVLTMASLVSSRRRLEDEREQLLVRAQQAQAEAEAANRTKDDFLALVSHELRGPLTTIFGWLPVLQRGDLTREDTARALETIKRNAVLQAKLIEDLLDVSRAAAGKFDITLQPVELAGVVRRATEALQPTAQAAGVKLQTTAVGEVAVLGDAERLEQVIVNLVTNAIKFTPAGGYIHTTLARVANTARLVVHDTGRGIESAVLPYIFDRFRQGEAGLRRPEGLGLGLAIAKYIVEAHGGTIRAESAGPGTGAAFTVDLPLHP